MFLEPVITYMQVISVTSLENSSMGHRHTLNNKIEKLYYKQKLIKYLH